MASLYFLIFGRGMIAENKYVPFLREILAARPGSPQPETVFIDVDRSDALDHRDWARTLGPGLSEIDKILILSPPTAHLENLRSVVQAYAAAGTALPEVFVEKPLYLTGEREAWVELLAQSASLRTRAFYIDHYRYKEPIACLFREKAEVLSWLGPLREIGWISLEAQPFWDSAAFAQGYFLEHACHFVSMLGQVFPEAGQAGRLAKGMTPCRMGDWRAWVQQGRPDCCRADSAALLYLETAGHGAPLPPPDAGVTVTVITGKGMADKKFLHLRGDRGYCTVWFNEGRLVLGTAAGVEERSLPTVDSYSQVARDILAESGDRSRLLSLEEGMAEQEAVIAIRSSLPGDEARMGRYRVGEIPSEIAAELGRMGAGTSQVRDCKSG